VFCHHFNLLLLSAVFVQLRPDRIAMAEDAQSRVQAAVKSFVNDVDRTHLRTLVTQHNTLTLLLVGHF
jgi:hypothetical protein